MQNFDFYTPTRMIFGRDTEKQVGTIVREYGYKKVLLHYGGGSIKKIGLYDALTASLAENGVAFIELGGVEPNPKLSLVKTGAQLCKEEGIELVLAVGGGSVMDSAKEIAIGALDDGGDQWDFSIKKREPKRALPVGVILTISASGSEMSASAVITNEEQQLKRGYNSPLHRPLFAICNPALTYSVSKFQTGCGIVDICMHTLERYFSVSPDTPLTDRLALALVRSTVEAGRAAIENPCDYDARATLMWASSLSHNDLTGAGRETFAPCHQIEHELSGMYDHVAHGAGLAVIFPAWAKYVYKAAPERFAQYAKDVFDVAYDGTNAEEAAREGIARTERYFQEIGMPVRLHELGVGTEGFGEMADKCTFFGGRTLPCHITLGKQEIVDIFELCK